MKEKIALFIILCLAIVIHANGQDLYLHSELSIKGEFLRLSELVVDKKLAPKFNDVFLGRVSYEKNRQIPLQFISKQLSREGYFTLTPKVTGGQSWVSVIRSKDAVEVGRLEAINKERVHPVKLQENLRTGRNQAYFTLNDSYERGVIIRKHMLSTKSDNKVVSSAVMDITDIIGKKLTRTLNKGTIIRSTYLEEVYLVERNDTVKINNQNTGVSISGVGKAYASGVMGDIVRVKRGREYIEAKVVGPKEVEVVK